jgi:hypothetical protein
VRQACRLGGGGGGRGRGKGTKGAMCGRASTINHTGGGEEEVGAGPVYCHNTEGEGWGGGRGAVLFQKRRMVVGNAGERI